METSFRQKEVWGKRKGKRRPVPRMFVKEKLMAVVEKAPVPSCPERKGLLRWRPSQEEKKRWRSRTRGG